MDYEIFDTNAILLGLLSAVLAAECIILFVKTQTMRHKLDSSVENVVKEERAKTESRRAELEIELKERAMRLEREYEDLAAEIRRDRAGLDARISKAAYDIETARRASMQARDERARYERLSGECRKLAREYAEKLAASSGLDPAKAMEEARAEAARLCERDLELYRSELFRDSAREVEAEARRVLIDAVQRAAPRLNSELNTCIVKLPGEAMKGRLIGKEGRNIRSFEAASEVTLVIDETPDSVMISSFDPGRRAVAKIALERLLSDGRINPGTIESALASARSEIEKAWIDYGRAAAEQLNVRGLPAEILSELGKLRFHLSLNQNTLEHSIETARIASILSAELGCDPAIAKRAALLHDIGKASESELSHARAGAQLLRRCGENDLVVRAVEGHHNEISGGLYGAIVQIADAISSTRIGARMTPSDGYFTRMKTLEGTAASFDGVLSAYALQAGRELRVIVEPETVDDAQAAKLAAMIRDSLSEKLDNSVPVKITLIRERRFVETL